MSVEQHLFTKFDNHEQTQKEITRLFMPSTILWNKEFEIDENTYPIEKIKSENPFINGLITWLLKQGETVDIGNLPQVDAIVRQRFAKKDIPYSKTIHGWVMGKVKPSQDQAYRYNCYDFCIALGMDCAETAEFFFKSFQIMPYNYKNRIDAIYFYAILHNKSYHEIVKMKASAKLFASTNDDTVHTAHIGRQIMDIDDDVEFMLYLQNQCYDAQHQSMSARRIAMDLIERDKELANVTTISKLLDAITGYNNQIDHRNINAGISKGVFPKEFTKSFPDGNEISKIVKGNCVSDESLRKLLILLCFYNYYANRAQKISKSLDERDITTSKDEFTDEANAILAQCGYIQLYPLNLFDWHILHCTNSVDPIGVLHTLITELYDNQCTDE